MKLNFNLSFNQIASKRTQSLLDFRHIIPSHMALPPPTRSKTPVTDLDAPDAVTQHGMENQSATLNNSNNQNIIASHNHTNHGRSESSRKTSIPTVQNKNFHCLNADEEKHSIAGDPIYQTISSEKGAKLGRNCISLENLRTLTIKNDLNSYGNNLLQNHGQAPYYVLPAFPPPPTGYNITHYFSHKPHAAHYMFGPSPYHPPMPPQPHPPPPPQPHMMPTPQQSAYFHQNYRMPFTNYGGYANPNPYSNLSNTNSRQSIGNESDDYRKYRDVAL